VVSVADWRKGHEEYEQARAEGLRQAGVPFQELLKAGKPIFVASWRIGTHKTLIEAGAPDWLIQPAIYGGASLVRVYSDDTVEPAEFYGDRDPVTGINERIPVPPSSRVPG
jgi:hypothetical protein